MNKPLAAVSFVVLALAFPGVALCDSSEAETTAIREVERQQQDAWNRHDADGAPAQIGDNAEINELGWFSPDELPTPLHIYFQNLLAGRCWPESLANLPFTIHPKP